MENLYVELVSNLRVRGEVIALNTLDQIAKKADGELYRSMFSFGEEVKDYIHKTGSISGFDGIVNIDQVVIDVDGETEEAYIKVVRLTDLLFKKMVQRKNMQVYFSGRGFHVYLHPSLFNITPSTDAHKELRDIISQQFGEYADIIYDKVRLIRVPNSLNKKTNLYKIPISIDELYNSTPFDIIDLAKVQRWEYKVNIESGEHLFRLEKAPITERSHSKSTIRHNKYNCIHNILDNPPISGERHNHVLRLASHFHRQGYSTEVTTAIVDNWVNDKSETPDIIKTINDVYQWDSFYSCKDELLKRYCEKSCIFYEGADDVFDIKDMYAEYQDRLTRKNEVIEVGKILKTGVKFDVFAGELVTLLGATGSGKTALVQNIIANINLPTLFFSLEMPAYRMYSRFAQVLTGYAKEELDIATLKRINKQLKHIVLTPKAIYPNEIIKMVEIYKPKVLVVDHLLLMRSQHRDEYTRVGELTAELKQLALAENLIIFAVSQVGRDSAKEGLTTFSGKGSGSIENDSDKVLGFSKPSRLSNEARITCLKDREGQALDLTVNIKNFKIT